MRAEVAAMPPRVRVEAVVGAPRLRRRLACARRPVTALVALLALASAAAEERPWHDPLLRAVSADYRGALVQRERLRAEITALPETPRNQQSGRMGFQAYRTGRAPINFPVWIEVELPEEAELDAVVLVPVDAPHRDFPGPGYGFPLRFRVDVLGVETESTLANYAAQALPNPGGLPVWIAAKGARGRRVRVTMTEPWTADGQFFGFALGEIMAMRGNRNLAAGARVTASEQFESLAIWGKANLTDGQSLLGAPLGAARSPSRGYHSAIVESADATKWVQVDLGEPTAINEVRLIGASGRIFPGRPGFGFPVRFKVEAADEADFSRPAMLANFTGTDFPNPASNPVVVPALGVRARYVRVTATKLWERAENFTFALAELQVYAGDRNVALDRPVSFLDTYESGANRTWLPQFLTDDFASEQRLVEWPEWLRGLSRRREALAELTRAEQEIFRIRETAGERLADALWLTGAVALAGVLALMSRVRRARERALECLRQRIASDLHDEIGSNLGSIALLSELGLHRFGGPAPGDLEEIRRVARQTADSMRDIVELIQRPAATGDDFVAKLREIAARLLAGLEWTFEVGVALELPSLTAQRHLLLAFKEALHNIRKHAAARRVTIDFLRDGAQLRLRIVDDGTGFEPRAVVEGHGLANLRHRAAALSGELSLESAPGRGTTLTLLLDPSALRA
ncbi:MAG: hypothetical protein EXS41_04090 [Opitutaceae bacterium]|nr:hypothetical protein [Opitutaceae bacterium]